MARSSIAFLAGLGTGYLNATEKEKDRSRQAKLDQITFDRADRENEQAAEAKKAKANLAAAYQPATVNENAATLDTSGKPVLYPDADVAQSDYRQARMLAENGTPEAAPATINAPKPTFAAGGIQFADKASAQAGADAYNKPEAQTQRVIAALGSTDPLKAMDLDNQQALRGRETTKFNQDQEKRTKELAEEGVFDGLKALSTGDAAGMVAAFNKSGKYKIEGEPVLTPVKKTVPGLGQVDTYNATFQVVGPDGKTTTQTVNSFDTRLKLMSFERQYAAQLSASKESREGRESDAKARYYDNMGAAAGVRAENSGAGNEVDRMSEIDKSTLSGIYKQRDTINTAITKAQAEGTWDAASPGSKALTTKLATLGLQEAQLQQRYAETNAAAPDPLGVRKPKGNMAAGSQPAPGSAKSGQVDILNQEWNKAQANLVSATSPEEQARAQGDLTSLKREFANLKTQPPGGPAAQPASPPAAKNMAATVQAVPTPAALVAAQDIPEPPPTTRQVGMSVMKNPQYQAWEEKYGEAYRAKQANEQSASSAAALAAKSGFNPYAQNKVR